ncbi:MAG: T9SS type A sorting domain-containing protein [Bacteroidia bacterium]|nr:T9SS type A sorting domain-containing protein [Bacteroidia bacterium]
MKAKLLSSLFLILCLGFYFYKCASEQESSSESRDPIHIVKKKEKGKKFDSPDEYSKLFDELRTKEGDERPAYSYNYKQEALQRAYRNGPILSRRAVTFTERGPANVPGRTRSILPDPADPLSTWLAASVSGGIWKSSNAGQNWIHITPDLPNLQFSTMAQSNANPNIIYAGTGERGLGGANGDGDGIFKSSDRGNSWTQLSVGAEDPFFQNITRLIVSPTDADLVLASGGTEFFGSTPAGQNSGIFRSTDGGQSWTRTFSDAFTISQIIAAPSDFNRQYLSIVGRGVFRSDDGGESWQEINNGMPNSVNRLELAVGRNNPDWVFASLERWQKDAQGNDIRRGVIYYSLDGGNQWQEARSVNGGLDPDLLGGQGWYDNTIMVSPMTDSVLFVGGVDLWKINLLPDGNGGFEKNVGVLVDSYFRASGQDRGKNSWFSGGVHPDQHFLTYLPGDAGDEFRILLGDDGGIFVSNSSVDPGFENGSWNMVGNTYNTTQFYGADKRPDRRQYAGGAQDNGTWAFAGALIGDDNAEADFSSPYRFVIGGDGFEVAWNKADPSKLLGGSQFNNFVLVDVANGNSESATQGLDDVGGGNAPFVSRIANEATDPDLVYTGGPSGLWRSDDFGRTWSLTPINNNWFGSPDVAVSLANPQVVWIATGMSGNRDVYVSTDGGSSLRRAQEIADIGRISGLYTDPLDENTAYMLFSPKGVPKILRSRDLGRSWEDLSGFQEGIDRGFPDVSVFSLQVMPHAPGTIWAGTDIGIFETTDDGQSWQIIDEFPKTIIWDMKWVDDEIVIATHGRGIWTATIDELGNVPLPDPILGPKVLCLTSDILESDGLVLEAELREAYDSTQILLNGIRKESINGNSIPEVIKRKYIDNRDIDITIRLIGYKDGEAYSSGKVLLKEEDRIDFILPVASYQSDFERATDFALSDSFQIGNLTGFSGNVLHTNHPYTSGIDLTGGVGNYTATLRFPIVVSATDPILRYKDVAIVELGQQGAVFGQANFFDFVVVEGSKDLKNWEPLENGYDASFDGRWTNAYNSSQDGTSSMFVNHAVDLSNTFAAGDTIAIRFRLFTDPLATGWGWAIDDLEIQHDAGGINFNNLKQDIALFPNPTEGPIRMLLESEGFARYDYQVIDASGRKVLEGDFGLNGIGVVDLDLSLLAGGIYFLRIMDEGIEVDVKKVIRR